MPNSVQTASEVPSALHLSHGHGCDAVETEGEYRQVRVLVEGASPRGFEPLLPA